VKESGYRILDHIFSETECDGLLSTLSEGSARKGRAGTRHLMSYPPVAAMAADIRMITIAKAALGPEAIPFRATLFEKSGQMNWLIAWHQDTALPLISRFESPGWGPWSQKGGVHYAHAPTWALSRILALRVHLDASSSENGPLRVIPGSHGGGVLSDDAVHDYAVSHSAVECTVGRGGVLAMSPMVIHCSSKARVADPRRVLHVEYADSLDLALGVKLAVA
jgi:ectoine hydroxylase-related dioxygenase (phytanoyl-CoA dioxygenase family)